MDQRELQRLISIGHLYAIYARAIDEKRYDLLRRVFTPDAVLDYRVGPHKFGCTGADAAAAFKAFLDRCYWTNHLIAQPMVEVDDKNVVRATARVIATHLQKRTNGDSSRWILRGSYHDVLSESADGWRISKRLCICTDSEGVFLDENVELFETVAWVDAQEIL